MIVMLHFSYCYFVSMTVSFFGGTMLQLLCHCGCYHVVVVAAVVPVAVVISSCCSRFFKLA